jgi:hypothetical protein
MKRWLLKQWHRFTLGRTAHRILADGQSFPGSVWYLAHLIEQATKEGLPVGVTAEVVKRRANDVPPGTVRIVLEVWEW